MKHLLKIFLLLSGAIQSQLDFPQKLDLGDIEEAYELKGELTVKNVSNNKVFLMRADADPGVKIYTSKKTLLAGDTCLLIISFVPEKKGNFKTEIRLVASDKATPYSIAITGNIQKIKLDDKQACFYFGNKRNTSIKPTEEILVAPPLTEKKDNSNKIPEQKSEPLVTFSPIAEKTNETPQKKTEKIKSVEERRDDFSIEEYKPNNITFLVDISGSMKDSLKLPLMKIALHQLIDEIRTVDKLTFITYADTIKILKEAANAEERKALHEVVDKLKAKGMTKGKKAILFSQEVTQRNFIEGGNNQIIIATDGQFKFDKEDQKKWDMRQQNRAIILTTVAFGTEKEALRNLKSIAKKGKGSFIHITNKADSDLLFLQEIKTRSKIEQNNR